MDVKNMGTNLKFLHCSACYQQHTHTVQTGFRYYYCNYYFILLTRSSAITMKLHDAPYGIPTEILSTTAQLHEKSHLKKSFSRSAEMV